MNAEEVIESHPLRLLEGRKALPEGEVSLLLARSGVGKSAALINFALEEILQGRHVYHYSAGMASEKTHQYYRKILGDYTRHYHPSNDSTRWEEAYHHFTVISYLDADRMIDDLAEETETILSCTDVKPTLVVVDGLDFCDATQEHLARLCGVAGTHGVKLLASMTVHRKADGQVDLEGPLDAAQSLTDHVYFLEPDPARDRINLELISKEGNELLPVYFCPHDFIFKAA